jgi:hypothetical protein
MALALPSSLYLPSTPRSEGSQLLPLFPALLAALLALFAPLCPIWHLAPSCTCTSGAPYPLPLLAAKAGPPPLHHLLPSDRCAPAAVVPAPHSAFAAPHGIRPPGSPYCTHHHHSVHSVGVFMFTVPPSYHSARASLLQKSQTATNLGIPEIVLKTCTCERPRTLNNNVQMPSGGSPPFPPR